MSFRFCPNLNGRTTHSFIPFLYAGNEQEEIVKAKVFQIENHRWSYSSDVVSIPISASTAMMVTGKEPLRRRVRDRREGAAVSSGPVSLSNTVMEQLLGMLGFSRSKSVTYQAFVSAVLACPKAMALLRDKGVRPEQCAALYCKSYSRVPPPCLSPVGN